MRCRSATRSRAAPEGKSLDRLETKGYLKSRLADPTPERGGRAKRYYALRPRAVEALKDSRRALVALWRGLERVLGQA
jgi:DNA-binding PadR family transcriptional regulator